jgi:prepilin-type N-terminal cleavage/methylation domain-containing protein
MDFLCKSQGKFWPKKKVHGEPETREQNRKGTAMRNKKGITLVELLIVVMILGALAAIALPRISQSASNARQRACDTNVSLINSAIEMYYVDTGSYPASLSNVVNNTTYFPDGAPVCPLGGTYTMNSNHRVTCNH